MKSLLTHCRFSWVSLIYLQLQNQGSVYLEFYGLIHSFSQFLFVNLLVHFLRLALKNSSEELPSHMLELIARNKDWQVNIVGNEEKDRFMDTVFGNTRCTTRSHSLTD